MGQEHVDRLKLEGIPMPSEAYVDTLRIRRGEKGTFVAALTTVEAGRRRRFVGVGEDVAEAVVKSGEAAVAEKAART